MYSYYEIQIGDVIEEYIGTGSSDRATEKEYTIISVTKTIAKSEYRRFKRTAESYSEPKVFCTRNLDQSNKWDVRCYRVKQK